MNSASKPVHPGEEGEGKGATGTRGPGTISSSKEAGDWVLIFICRPRWYIWERAVDGRGCFLDFLL